MAESCPASLVCKNKRIKRFLSVSKKTVVPKVQNWAKKSDILTIEVLKV